MNTQTIINKVMEQNGIHEDRISKLVFQFFYEGTPTAKILKTFCINRWNISVPLFPLLRSVEFQVCFENEDFVYDMNNYDLDMQSNGKKWEIYEEFSLIEWVYEQVYEASWSLQLDADEKFIDKRKWMKS